MRWRATRLGDLITGKQPTGRNATGRTWICGTPARIPAAPHRRATKPKPVACSGSADCDGLLAVVSRRHRFAKNRKLELTELAKESLLLLRRDYASRGWFEAACNVAHIRPRVVLESAAPHTLLALARTGDDVAIVPSNVAIPSRGVHAMPIVHRGVPLGRWTVVAWDPQRFLSPYAEAFIDELVTYCSRHYPGREFINRVPALPKPAGMRE